MVRAAVSLGSNMGDRLAVLRRAVGDLGGLGALIAVSDLYETDPVGPVDQGPFYNAVVVIETDLGAEDLVSGLLEIERRLGRVRGRRWGPRIIDLDLILHGATVIRTETVSVPHPRYRERRFVLAPLVEVWQDARDPDGTLVCEMLRDVTEQTVRNLNHTGWVHVVGRNVPNRSGNRR